MYSTEPRRRDTYLVMVVKAMVALQRGPTQQISQQAIKAYLGDNMLPSGKEVHAPSFRKALAMAEKEKYLKRAESKMSYTVTPEGRSLIKSGASKNKKTKKTATTTKTRSRSRAKGQAKSKAKASTSTTKTTKKRSSSSSAAATSKKRKRAPSSTAKKRAASSAKKQKTTRGASTKAKTATKPAKPRAKPLKFAARLKATKDLYLEQAEERTAACKKCLQAFFRQYKSVVSCLLFSQEVSVADAPTSSASSSSSCAGVQVQGTNGGSKFRFRLKGDSREWSSGGHVTAAALGVESKDAGVTNSGKDEESKKARIIAEELEGFEVDHADTLTEFFGSNGTWTMRAEGNSFSMVAGNHMMNADMEVDSEEEEDANADAAGEDEDEDEQTEEENKSNQKVTESKDAKEEVKSPIDVTPVATAPAPEATVAVESDKQNNNAPNSSASVSAVTAAAAAVPAQ